MEKKSRDDELKKLGLLKVEAFVWGGTTSSSETSITTTSVPVSDGATRQELHRKKQEMMGLVQLNLTIPSTADIRANMCRLAKRVVETRDWQKALALEPSVIFLTNRVESEKVRNLRLEDLEDRIRKLRPFVNFHNDLKAERGLRRFTLYLLGLVDSPWLKPSRHTTGPLLDFEKKE